MFSVVLNLAYYVAQRDLRYELYILLITRMSIKVDFSESKFGRQSSRNKVRVRYKVILQFNCNVIQVNDFFIYLI